MSAHKFEEVIKGEFILLKKVTTDDAEFIYNLRTSPAAKLLNKPKDYSIQSQVKWIETRSEDECNYIILNKRDQKVGMVGIYNCDFNSGIFECGRLLILPEYIERGSPYGLEALKIGYGYGFNEMGMRKISGVIAGSNARVIRLQKHLGMTQEGLLKAHALINGTYEDLCVFSLFKEDYWKYAETINQRLEKYR